MTILKSTAVKSGIAITLIGVGLLLAAWQYISFPNLPGRPALGEKHTVASSDAWHVYYERGDGPTVVLLSSLGRPASDFNELTTVLAESGFRTVTVDFNFSEKTIDKPNLSLMQLSESVDRIINESGISQLEQIVLIGHAFGNRLARAYASKHSDRVRAAILLAAGGRVPIAQDIRAALGDCFDRITTKAAHLRALRKAFFAQASSIPSYWYHGWDRSLARVQIYATQHTPYEEWWDAGGVPLLVIQGDEDSIAPASHTSELLKAEFGDQVDIAIASPAGHALLPEQPNFIADTIIGYLNTFGLFP